MGRVDRLAEATRPAASGRPPRRSPPTDPLRVPSSTRTTSRTPAVSAAAVRITGATALALRATDSTISSRRDDLVPSARCAPWLRRAAGRSSPSGAAPMSGARRGSKRRPADWNRATKPPPSTLRTPERCQAERQPSTGVRPPAAAAPGAAVKAEPAAAGTAGCRHHPSAAEGRECGWLPPSLTAAPRSPRHWAGRRARW